MADNEPSIPELIAIWQEAAQAVLELGTSLDAAQWRAATPCPGWDAGDIVAHVVDIEQLLAGLPRPDHQVDTASLAHVRSDLGQFTEIGVDARRAYPQADVLTELREVIPVRRAQLDAVPDGDPVMSPFGKPTTMDRLVRMRTFDIWAHEQDMRAATGIDGGWGSRPAAIACTQMVRGLPYVWARTVAAPEGSTLRVVVTGEQDVDVTIRANADATGELVDTVDEPTARLDAPWPDFMRLACGRIDVEDTGLRSRITLSGDPVLAASLLPALAITP